MNRRLTLSLLLLALPTLAAAEIYRWVDAEGRVHFTQTPPPESRYQKVDPRVSPASASKGTAQIEQYVEQGAKARAEAAQQKSKDQEQALARATQCAQAQARLKMLDERGQRRLASANDKGEMERWTTEKYDEERSKTQEAIKDSCG
jgi:hypothetical protein